MAVDVSVLRVFTDTSGRHGNPLGVVDAAVVPPTDRQRVAAELGYSETIFIDLPAAGEFTASAHIFTPKVELPFAGHPTVGAAWWLENRGTPVTTLHVPAGDVEVDRQRRSDGDVTVISARAHWAPAFTMHQLESVDEVLGAAADDYADDAGHYVWAWLDEWGTSIRSRLFASVLGVPEDEATGAAAVRITAQLGRDLEITQGRGSRLYTTWRADGRVTVGGRVADDGVRRL